MQSTLQVFLKCKEEPEGQVGLAIWEYDLIEGTAFHPLQAPPKFCNWLFMKKCICNTKSQVGTELK